MHVKYIGYNELFLKNHNYFLPINFTFSYEFGMIQIVSVTIALPRKLSIFRLKSIMQTKYTQNRRPISIKTLGLRPIPKKGTTFDLGYNEPRL